MTSSVFTRNLKSGVQHTSNGWMPTYILKRSLKSHLKVWNGRMRANIFTHNLKPRRKVCNGWMGANVFACNLKLTSEGLSRKDESQRFRTVGLRWINEIKPEFLHVNWSHISRVQYRSNRWMTCSIHAHNNSKSTRQGMWMGDNWWMTYSIHAHILKAHLKVCNGWRPYSIHAHSLKAHLKVCNEWVDDMLHSYTYSESTPQGMQWMGR